MHDRQTRYSDKLPVPPLPLIEPGRLFEAQDPYVVPLRETDNRAGYSVNAEWRYGKRILIQAGGRMVEHKDSPLRPGLLWT